MVDSRDFPIAVARPRHQRLASAPISWGASSSSTAITADEPTVDGGPVRDAWENIAFLRHTAPMTQEVYR